MANKNNYPGLVVLSTTRGRGRTQYWIPVQHIRAIIQDSMGSVAIVVSGDTDLEVDEQIEIVLRRYQDALDAIS